MRRLSTMLCVAALTATGAQAAAPNEIGTTLSVIDVVTAELSTERRNLATGDAVRQNEVIQAALQARSEFRLADDTKLALGPGARMVLDRFVYDPDKKAGNIALDLAKGAFRFMTGVASKPSYVVRVPNASITVRGTIFDVFVQDNGTAWLLLHEGGVKVCNDRGDCRILDEPGKLILVNDKGDVGKPFRWASMQGAQGFSFDEAFPFVGDAPSIDPKPVFTRQALIEDTPAPKKPKGPKRERKAEASEPTSPGGKLEPAVTTDPQPKKPVKIVVRKPKPKKPVAGTDGKGPTRIGTKPPHQKKPKTDKADVSDKKSKWKRIAEEAASHWINRNRGSKTVHDGPVLRGTGPVKFDRSTIKKYTGSGPTIVK